MKDVRKLEREIIKNLNSMSLDEIFLNSSGSAEQINRILMKIINRQHNPNPIRKLSTSCSIHRLTEAA